MFCDETLDAIEPMTAGDLTPSDRIAEHLASCPRCRAALGAAETLERMLQARPVPRPPQQFTARTMARVRRARWRIEQFLDAGFNVALTFVVLGVMVSVWLLVDRSGLTAVTTDALDVLQRGVVALVRRVAPALPLYAAATAVVLGALGLWWWAERDAAI